MRTGSKYVSTMAALKDALKRLPPYMGARCRDEDVEYYVFPQCWSSTALGFSGLGCRAITWSTTVVVIHPDRDAAVVYFGGRYAYTIPLHVGKNFEHMQDHLRRHNMIGVAEAARIGFETEAE